MTKNFKLKIKNTQLAKAAGLDKLKAKLSGEEQEKEKPEKQKAIPKAPPPETTEEKPRRIRAKSKSSFAPKETDEKIEDEEEEEKVLQTPPLQETSVEGKDETPSPLPVSEPEAQQVVEQPVQEKKEEVAERLGPTGRHIKDLLPPKKEKEAPKEATEKDTAADKDKVKKEVKPTEEEEKKELLKKGKKVKEFKDLKPKKQQLKSFDARDRQGLSESDDERWRKKRALKPQRHIREEQILRPTSLKVRLPLTIKDLAQEMKLKSSEIIQKLFLNGMTLTLNDILEDETIVQFIGNEFGCQIEIDTSEQERIQITAKNIQEEIDATNTDLLKIRPPVVAFMGHVDHGKTSLIDAIRKSNIAAGEAGAITQHIGAFRCKTAVGDLTVLDTPGHEAFSSMRARGAEVTDIVVLVVAGDEGMREQTREAIQHAKSANVTIVVAINKCDKPNFNAETVYRELSEIELLPEAWGGQTITVNTSAITGQGIPELLEMLALQAEVLELRANPTGRARGTVLESEMHKGLGVVATVLVQNGTLHQGDAIVFERHFGRVKTMQDEFGNKIEAAGPSTPVEMTGLSGLPAAGDPFIVVKSEKEARDIIEAREVGHKERALQQKKIPTLEKLLQEGAPEKKILKLILRGDVQGSVEALKTSILKIESNKAKAEVIFSGVGEISESDIQLAAASNAVILGFHTRIESHAEPLIKEMGITVRMFDIIYHAIEDVKSIMQGLLDKIEQENKTGTAEVKAVFKASQLGMIAGCQVIEGTISRNNKIKVIREGEVVWKGQMESLKRVKEDVKEVKKGLECGILLNGFNAVQVGDLLEAYEIIYLTQEL